MKINLINNLKVNLREQLWCNWTGLEGQSIGLRSYTTIFWPPTLITSLNQIFKTVVHFHFWWQSYSWPGETFPTRVVTSITAFSLTGDQPEPLHKPYGPKKCPHSLAMSSYFHSIKWTITSARRQSVGPL